MNDVPVTTVPHVRSKLADMVLAYVRRVLGDDAVAEVLARSGATGGAEAPGGAEVDWTSHARIVALADAAAAICGDPAIGRRAGEEHIRSMRRGADFLRATGSVGAAIALTVEASAKMSDGRAFSVELLEDDRARVVGRYFGMGHPAPFFCDYGAGTLSAVAELFGYLGVVAEPVCMCRGDDRCVYEVRWTPGPTAGAAAAGEIEASRQRVDGLADRFEQLHRMATELAEAEELDTVLARIVERAGLAVKARRHLLVVRTDDGGPPHLHHVGFPPEEAERFAAELLGGGHASRANEVVAEVASARRSYGYLATVYPEAASVSDLDRRLLDAYARHAAAAIEAVATLESARADRDTMEALLGLARALAQSGARTEVALRLAEAVPLVAGCDRADVWLWDEAADGMRLQAVYPGGCVDGEPAAFLSAADYADLLDRIREPQPFFVRASEAIPAMRRLMLKGGVARTAIVPIRKRDRFLGVVAAGYADVDGTGPAHESALLERLGGMADQVATALDNAELLERVREQALHDDLTGLPNRRLLEERAHQALAHAARNDAPVALLFVDLDRFKQVNDTLGHEAGDELIRQAGERLDGCLRSADTLARFGGDEFVALLPGTDAADAERVARRLVAAVEQPFRLGSEQVSISASVGIATAPADGEAFATLLQHADAAMYGFKTARRSRPAPA